MNHSGLARRWALVGGGLALLASQGAARAADRFVAHPRSKTINLVFTVTVPLGTYVFPATLTRKHGALTGTITMFDTDTCTLQPGSVDRSGSLSLTCVVAAGSLGTLTDTYNGALRFGSGRGKGTFYDSFAGEGTYTVVAAH